MLDTDLLMGDVTTWGILSWARLEELKSDSSTHLTVSFTLRQNYMYLFAVKRILCFMYMYFMREAVIEC